MNKKYNVPTFHYQPNPGIPALTTIKEEWDLKKLFYRSEKDPQIESDIRTAEGAYHAFAKKYKNADLSVMTVLKKALRDYESLAKMPELSRPSYYFSYRQSLNVADSVALKQSNLISNRLTKAANEIIFFELKLGKLPRVLQKQLLGAKDFAPYRYYLEKVFEAAQHMLSEPEEKILNLLGDTSYGMWVQGTEKITGDRSLSILGKKMPLNEAIESLDTYPKEKRSKVWRAITTELGAIAEVAENEINAIVTHKKITDELRGFKKPYEATVLDYENKLGGVESLVEAISTRGFALSKRFYEIKAKLHGVSALPYEHKYEPIAPTPTIDFKTAVAICRDAFYGLNPLYGELFDGMMKRGQVDVYPKKGKRGGAFMSSGTGLPTLVFLNHTDTFKSLETLAHEMGHAIHSERSKTQPILYSGYSTTTAETASTFFENLVLKALLKVASPEEKRTLLHDKITRDIATIERQIAFFNFELEMHERVRLHGALTKEELRSMMQKHLESYLGKGVSVHPDDGNSFVYISHFRYGFYVYTYTYGLLMSNMMHVRLAEDPSYVKQIDAFLTSGNRAPVETIFKDIGIDPLKVSTFIEALDLHEADIVEFNKLSNTFKKK